MSNELNYLSEAEIRSRCSEASFERGQRYYAGGGVQQRMQRDGGIEARVAGSQLYRVTIRQRSGVVEAFCSCPYDRGGDCKHVVATLLAWLHESESFRSATDLETALAARSKAELISILSDIAAAYPHLVDEFHLLGDLDTFNPEAVIGEIFAAMGPWGEIDINEAVTRMENVARQAVRLADQGREDLARHTYYALTLHCVRFCESYGAHDIFPDNIPYDFAAAYQDLALDQLDDHTNTIEREVRDMLRGDWAPEMLGVQDALNELWATLGL
jgi:hypothetical protein